MNKAEIQKLREDGMSEEDIQDVIKYEEEQKADEDLKKHDKNMQDLSNRVAKEKRIKLSEELDEMKETQFLGTKIGQQIISFVYDIVKASDIEIHPIQDTAKDVVTVMELGDNYVELLFFDDRYRSGSFFFDFSSLYQEGEEIKINYKVAFTQNLKHWVKKTRSLSFFNRMGDSHTDVLIYSDFWKSNKESSRLQARLKKYQAYAREKRNFENIMDKITPTLAKKIIAVLKDKEEYKDIF